MTQTTQTHADARPLPREVADLEQWVELSYAAGLTEEATESYVRYVLTGPHALDDKKKLSDFFNKTKGIGKLDALWKN